MAEITKVATTAPEGNDVILGEFTSWFNYDLPSEIKIGATREGCKIEVTKNIKEIVFDGAYGFTLDSDGVPLVRYEGIDIALTINNLYLNIINEKKISDCESDGTWESNDWSSTGGTYSAETSNVKVGYQATSITADTADYGGHEVFSSSKDLTVFDNSESSDTSDYIGFNIYISTAELTNLGSADIRILFHMDVEGTETNHFYYDVTASSLNADRYTAFKILKSAFTEVGSGDWSAVTGISVKLDATPSAETTFIIDDITLIKASTGSMITAVNGTSFSYTDETTYHKFVADNDIEEDDYIHNITVIGQKMDGKMIKFILENCLHDDNIGIALEEKDEVVNETKFTAHYSRTSVNTVPFKIREYV